jgi:hypothetical protein
MKIVNQISKTIKKLNIQKIINQIIKSFNKIIKWIMNNKTTAFMIYTSIILTIIGISIFSMSKRENFTDSDYDDSKNDGVIRQKYNYFKLDDASKLEIGYWSDDKKEDEKAIKQKTPIRERLESHWSNYRWDGYFNPKVSGKYTFQLNMDDSAALYLNDKQMAIIVMSDKVASPTITLEKNKSYKFTLLWGNESGGSIYDIKYKSPTDTEFKTLDLLSVEDWIGTRGKINGDSTDGNGDSTDGNGDSTDGNGDSTDGNGDGNGEEQENIGLYIGLGVGIFVILGGVIYFSI